MFLKQIINRYVILTKSIMYWLKNTSYLELTALDKINTLKVCLKNDIRVKFWRSIIHTTTKGNFTAIFKTAAE